MTGFCAAAWPARARTNANASRNWSVAPHLNTLTPDHMRDIRSSTTSRPPYICRGLTNAARIEHMVELRARPRLHDTPLGVLARHGPDHHRVEADPVLSTVSVRALPRAPGHPHDSAPTSSPSASASRRASAPAACRRRADAGTPTRGYRARCVRVLHLVRNRNVLGTLGGTAPVPESLYGWASRVQRRRVMIPAHDSSVPRLSLRGARGAARVHRGCQRATRTVERDPIGSRRLWIRIGCDRRGSRRAAEMGQAADRRGRQPARHDRPGIAAPPHHHERGRGRIPRVRHHPGRLPSPASRHDRRQFPVVRSVHLRPAGHDPHQDRQDGAGRGR